jgi:signal transduction histidine kinase
MAPSLLATSVLFSMSSSTGIPLATGFIANVIALTAVAGLMLLLRCTVFRRRRERAVSLPVVLFSGAALGCVKALLTNALLTWPTSLDFGSADLWGKAVSASLLGMLLLPAISVVFAARERFRLERSVLIAEVVQTESRRVASLRAAEHPLSTAHDAALVDFIEATTTRLRHAAEGNVNAAETLLDIVESDLRPLSHTIWQEQNAKYTDFSIRDLTKIAMQDHRFSVLLLSVAFAFSSLPFLISHAGVGEGFLRLALVVGLIVLILGGATQVRTVRPWHGIIVFWAAILSLCLTIELVSTALLGPLQQGGALTFGIIDLLFFAPVALIFGCIRVALASKTAIRAQLVPFVGTAGIDRHRQIMSLQYNRDMAQYLHSQVQNRMLASALRIGQSSVTGVPIDLKAELRSIADVLRQARTAVGRQNGGIKTLDEEIHELSQAWFKTLELHFDLVGDTSSWHPATVRSVSRLLDEIITNAVRHGLATEVRISIHSVTAQEVVIVALNNGVLDSPGPPGLGSSLYTTMAGANWMLDRDPVSGHTRLSLRLSLAGCGASA